MIDIPVGGRDGNPSLILQSGQFAKYKHVYDKLVKTLGKDNFTFMMEASGFSLNSNDDDENAEDDFNGRDDNKEENVMFLKDFELGKITISDAREIAVADLMNDDKIAKRTVFEINILRIELYLRILELKRSDLFHVKEGFDVLHEYDLYEDSDRYPSWLSEEFSKEATDMMDSDIIAYQEIQKASNSEAILFSYSKMRLLKSIDMYQHNPYILHKLYEMSIFQSNTEGQIKLKPIIKKLALQYVSAKLELALCTYYLNEPDPSVLYVIEGTDIKKIFPTVERFSEFELNLFAMLRLIVNIRMGNISSAIYYYRYVGMLNFESPLINKLQIEFSELLKEPFLQTIKEIDG